MNFIENEIFLLSLTFAVFLASRMLQSRTGLVFLNPILVSIVVLIAFLSFSGVSYGTDRKSVV